MICWTHPHEDHSKGMEDLLRNYSDKKTKIVIPSELSIVKNCMGEKSKKIYNYIFKEKAKGMRKNKGETKFVSEDKILEEIYYNGAKGIKFKIRALAPISNRLTSMEANCRYDSGQRCAHNFNEYSVVLLIEVNGIAFLFTGDIPNGAINELKYDNVNKKLKNVVFSKIPHHGSKHSEDIIEKYDFTTCSKMVCATTSLITGNSKLPDENILNHYKIHFGSVYCTSKLYKGNYDILKKYGIIKTTFKIPLIPTNGEVEVKYESEGDVFEYGKNIEQYKATISYKKCKKFKGKKYGLTKSKK